MTSTTENCCKHWRATITAVPGADTCRTAREPFDRWAGRKGRGEGRRGDSRREGEGGILLRRFLFLFFHVEFPSTRGARGISILFLEDDCKERGRRRVEKEGK